MAPLLESYVRTKPQTSEELDRATEKFVAGMRATVSNNFCILLEQGHTVQEIASRAEMETDVFRSLLNIPSDMPIEQLAAIFYALGMVAEFKLQN